MPSLRKTSGDLSITDAIRISGDERRWRILNVLFDCEAMASVDLARKVGTSATNLAKHLEILRSFGIVEQRIGRTYSLVPRFRLQNERALDIGPMIIRLDRFEKKQAKAPAATA